MNNRSRFPNRTLIPTLALAAFMVMGCEGRGEGGVAVADAWVRPMKVLESEDAASGRGNSAVYMTVENTGGSSDTLAGADSPVSERVEIHESFMDGDVMRMREVRALELPPGERVALKPGGLHIMLMGLRESLAVGDTVALVLRFRNAGAVELQVPVRASGPAGM